MKILFKGFFAIEKVAYIFRKFAPFDNKTTLSYFKAILWFVER